MSDYLPRASWESRFIAHGVDEPVWRPFSSVFEDAVEPSADTVGGEPGSDLMVPSLGFVVRDDDLKLVDCLGEGIKVGVPAFFVAGPNGATISAVLGVLVAAAKLIRQAFKKGAILSREQVRVLYVLRCNDGLTVAELASILQRTDPELDLASVTSELDALKESPLRDGSVVALVARDRAGKWRPAGL